MGELQEIVAKALEAIKACDDEAKIEEIRLEYFSKKGYFTEQMKSLGKLSRKNVLRWEQRLTVPNRRL